MMSLLKHERGFTLPELAVVIVVIGLLLGAAFLLLRPVDYAQAERVAQRRTDLAQLMQAFQQYKMKNGALPPQIPTKATPIASSEDGSNYDACLYLVPGFIDDIPLDPDEGLQFDIETELPTHTGCDDEGIAYYSGYTIRRHDDGRLTLAAKEADGKKLSLTR